MAIKTDCTEFEQNFYRTADQNKTRPEKKFAVPFRAQDRRFDHIGVSAGQVQQSSPHLLDGRQLSGFVAHNASLTNEFPSRLELRFHQDDHLPATALVQRRRKAAFTTGGRTNVAEMNATSITMRSTFSPMTSAVK